MKAIVAVDSNWGIGNKGRLLQSIPEDMKFFKEKTKGNIVVMGRTTFESLPNKSPLKDRVNIVLTRNNNFVDDRLIICHSIEETIEVLKQYDNDQIYIIGGEAIYNYFLPYCDTAYVTKINNSYVADKYFINLDNEEEWQLIAKSEEKEYNGISFNFNEYRRK